MWTGGRKGRVKEEKSSEEEKEEEYGGE